jgi:hypothetical protein
MCQVPHTRLRIDNYVFEEWKHPHKSDLSARVIGDFIAWRKNEKFHISLKTLVASLDRGVHKIKIATRSRVGMPLIR